MDKSAIAILISVGSLLVAGLSLGWNIYRDIVLKPRVRVSFGKRVILHSSLPQPLTKLVITATNVGPGSVKLNTIAFRNTSWLKRLTRTSELAVIMPDWTEAMSSRLPARVEPGDQIDLLLPYDDQCCMSTPCTHIGLSDSFGRVHWALSRQVRATREQWLKDFAKRTV